MTAAATKLKIAEIADAFEAGAELSATDRAIILPPLDGRRHR